MNPIEQTIFTMICMMGAYYYGVYYVTKNNLEHVAQVTLHNLLEEGYIKIDEDNNIIKLEDD